jgi:hypothetical protein
VPYCFDVRFRTPRPVVADNFDEVFNPAPFKRPLRFYRPDGMNRHDGWLAVESCGYADFAEAKSSGALLQEGLLIAAAKEKVGVEFYLRGAAKAIQVYPGGQFELRDPGLPLPTILSDHELKEMVGAAVESATSLTANQRVAAELLNDSFFKMSPEASFLLRVSAVEALCPQADQTDAFRAIVDRVLALIPSDAPRPDWDQIEQALNRLAARQSVRSAYTSKIRQLIGNDKAQEFDALYGRRSNFLHDGGGRGTLGDAADAALEIGLELLLADIAHIWVPWRSPIRLLRKGIYSPLRGTALRVDDEQTILYTRGSVDFFRTYPGMYVPTPLLLRAQRRDSSDWNLLLRETLALTKMNLNGTQFDGALPITLKAARQVGEILKYVPADVVPDPRYRFYM